MKNTTMVAVLGAVGGIAIALIGMKVYTRMNHGDGGVIGGGVIVEGDGGAVTPQPPPAGKEPEPVPMAPIEKKTIPPAAVERVVESRTMKGNMAMTGRGEDAKWGIGKSANFQYSVFIIAKSKILSKEILPGGNIKMVELRTFEAVQDSLVVSDLDFRLALNTLPIEEFSNAIDAAVDTWTVLSGDPSIQAVRAGKDFVRAQLESVDGKGARDLLGMTGFQLSGESEAWLNKLASANVKKAIGGIRPISGKTYKVSYYQNKSGAPLMVMFTYEDGSPVTDEEEKMVLKRVNAFIDYNMVPNKECRPGDSWQVAAEDMQEMFDPFVEGTYTGKLTVTRKSDNEDGDWTLAMAPGNINVVGANGSTTGTLNVEGGSARVNPESVTLNEVNVAGKAALTKTSKHHLLFTAKISGKCDFQGKLITIEE